MDDRLQLAGRLLVVFDGHCGLCNRSVRWFLVRDRLDRMRFAPSDAPQLAGLLARYGLAADNPELTPTSILVFEHVGVPGERVLIRSQAILGLLRELPAPWPAAAAVLALVPRPLRDIVYRFIARIRYRVWGRYDSCPIPTPEERKRFLL
jgi:predicted DCC family thiol-disulfide oxidoreductase YuxK